MSDLRIGFIGLGNVGGQLAGNLLRHGMELTVRDLDPQRVASFVARRFPFGRATVYVLVRDGQP